VSVKRNSRHVYWYLDVANDPSKSSTGTGTTGAPVVAALLAWLVVMVNDSLARLCSCRCDVAAAAAIA
jgi:hypothetical protein